MILSKLGKITLKLLGKSLNLFVCVLEFGCVCVERERERERELPSLKKRAKGC